MSDSLIDKIIAYVNRLPSPHTKIFLGLVVGGQMGRVGKEKTAYPHRDAYFVMNGPVGNIAGG